MKTLQDVQTWRGMKMIDADGDKIGTIEDILLDRQSGERAWASVKTGLFGLKHTLVPIRDELSPEEERKLREYYGLSDYDEWQGEDHTTALALPDEEEDRARLAAAETEAGDARRRSSACGWGVSSWRRFPPRRRSPYRTAERPPPGFGHGLERPSRSFYRRGSPPNAR